MSCDGGELVVRGLMREGVEAVFAIADISYAPILRSATEHGIRIIGPRHESAGGHMAEAWARVTGRPAVAMGTMGPGAANMVSSTITAWIEGVPVLFIATQRTRKTAHAARRGKFQHTPQLEVFAPITKWAAAVPDAARIPEYIREAFRVMLTGRPGPVYLEFNDDLLRDGVREGAVRFPEPRAYRSEIHAPDPKAVREAVAILRDARQPLIVAGDGVTQSGAWEELRALVEQTGALVTTTLGSRGGVPEEHPQYVAALYPSGRKLARIADAVLAIGTPVGEILGWGAPPMWGEYDKQRWMQLDIDPLAIGANREVEVGMVGDARAGLRMMLECLREEQAQPGIKPAVQNLCQTYRSERESLMNKSRQMDQTPIAPARLAWEVGDWMPADAITVFDGGNTTVWAHLFTRFTRPRSFLWTSHFGHLGTGLPYAIGASLAAPERPVVLFCGDGAIGFNLQEMETATRSGAKVIAIINNDRAWGMEHLAMRTEFGQTYGVEMADVRYDRVAEGLGWRSRYIEQPKEIRPALQWAAEGPESVLLQVRTDTRANIEPPGLLELGDMYAGRTSPLDTGPMMAMRYIGFRLEGLLKKGEE